MNAASASSLWSVTLEEFREKVASRDASVAAVAVAAVSASCALSLVVMVLEIAGSRKNFRGDRRRLEVLLAAANAAIAGLNVCAEAAELAEGPVATDLGGAAMLLAGAVRAMLLSVDANLAALGETEFRDQAAVERGELEDRAIRQSTAIRKR